MTIKEKANEFARQQGFLKAIYSTQWKDYSCYETVYSEEFTCTGIPQWILEKDGILRWATFDEVMEIIDNLPNEYDDEDN